MNIATDQKPTKPASVPDRQTIDTLWDYLTKTVAKTSIDQRVPIQRLCILVAPNLKPVFAMMDDVWGLEVYSHPLMPDGLVHVRAGGRYDYGSKLLNDMWERLRTV